MERTEVVKLVGRIFAAKSEDEVSALTEQLEEELGTGAVNDVLFYGPTNDPEEIADLLLRLPLRRILVTPPPDSSEDR